MSGDVSRRSRGADSVQVGRGYGMMAGMSIQARALTYKRQKEQSAAIRLLHADHAPVLLAVVAEHFPRGAEARPAEQLYHLMADDFTVLRHTFELPKTPQAYCNDWVKAGWLVRKAGTKETGETLEPSEQALTALHMMDRVSAPRSAVTASRVASISNALQALARDTDPDIDSRLKHLEAERARIEAEYNLDKPFIIQYLLYIKGIFMLDFGTTFSGVPVATTSPPPAPPTWCGRSRSRTA